MAFVYICSCVSIKHSQWWCVTKALCWNTYFNANSIELHIDKQIRGGWHGCCVEMLCACGQSFIHVHQNQTKFSHNRNVAVDSSFSEKQDRTKNIANSPESLVPSPFELSMIKNYTFWGHSSKRPVDILVSFCFSAYNYCLDTSTTFLVNNRTSPNFWSKCRLQSIRLPFWTLQKNEP